MNIGQRIAAEMGTLAYMCGDKFGRIEKIEGEAFFVRMERSGRLVPFRADQFRADVRERQPGPSDKNHALSRLRQAIIDNTKGDLFWIGEILLSELEKETGFKGETDR